MKKFITLLLTSIVTLSLVACGTSSSSNNSEDKKIIKVGATPVPHKEILECIKDDLSEKGYELQIIEFSDYKVLNSALADKEIDANFFQHIPFLDEEVKNRGYDLDYTVKVHLEPLGLYSTTLKDFKDLKDGAKIAVPNDPTNEARALRLLEENGLIKLNSGDLITVRDITENPKNLSISEIDAAQLPRTIQDVDAAVINTNFAIQANFNPSEDALLLESKDSPYANILAVRKSDKDSPAIKALSESLNSYKVTKFIEDKYNGSILPAF